MRMDRHHLLEIILWPNSDGTFRKIINTGKRLRELGIYYDWKLTITIPADKHSRMHSHNRSDEYWSKVSQSMSAARKGKKLSEDVNKLVETLNTNNKKSGVEVPSESGNRTEEMLTIICGSLAGLIY